MRKIFFLFFLLAAGSSAAEEIPCVWESAPAHLGDGAIVVLDLGSIEGDFFIEGLPKRGSDFGSFRAINVDTSKNGNGKVTSRLSVAVFGVGRIEALGLRLKILTEKGEKSVEAVIPAIDVKNRLNENDAAPPVAVPVSIPKPFPLALAIAGIGSLLAVIVAAVFLSRRKPLRSAAEKNKITVENMPEEWMIRKLEALLEKRLLSPRDYGDISRDIRLFLETKMKFKALGSTTSELREILSFEWPFKNLGLSDFMSVFVFCDSVKFAKHFPSEEEEKELRAILKKLKEEISMMVVARKKAA